MLPTLNFPCWSSPNKEQLGSPIHFGETTTERVSPKKITTLLYFGGSHTLIRNSPVCSPGEQAASRIPVRVISVTNYHERRRLIQVPACHCRRQRRKQPRRRRLESISLSSSEVTETWRRVLPPPPQLLPPPPRCRLKRAAYIVIHR